MDVWCETTISYIKIWNHPIENNHLEMVVGGSRYIYIYIYIYICFFLRKQHYFTLP